MRLGPARTLADKKQANILDPSGEIEIVRDLLMHRVEERRPAIRKEGRDFTIRVQSRPTPFAIDADEDDLHVRLRPSGDGRRTTPLSDWARTPAKDTPADQRRRVHRRREVRRISGGVHLSVGLALGAALPETKIGNIVVLDAWSNAWKPAAPDDDPHTTTLAVERVRIEKAEASETKNRAAVFVTLTPEPDRTAFERLLNESGANYASAEVISVTGSQRNDPREAARLSAAVAQEIKRLSASRGRAEIHLAFHGPYTMAVLVGRYLNTLRTVVYEWDGKTSSGPSYVPVIALEPGVAGGPITDVLASGPTPML